MNPAFAGSERCPRLTLNYRNQWPLLGSTYVTYSVSYDQYVDPLEGGVGLLLINDVQGDGAITSTMVSGMYSYLFKVNRFMNVRAGFQATYVQKSLNWDFIFPDMIHPLYGPIYPTTQQTPSSDFLKQNYFDFSAGVLATTPKYYFGVAVHHLTEHEESWAINGDINADAVLPRKYTVHFGTSIPLENRRFKRGELSLSPQFVFQQQQDFQQLNYGLYLSRSNIVAGAWVRQNFGFHYDSFILMVGFIQDKLKFAYSYDLTISKLRNQTLGAHEISYSMIFNCKRKLKKFRKINCPSF